MQQALLLAAGSLTKNTSELFRSDLSVAVAKTLQDRVPVRASALGTPCFSSALLQGTPEPLWPELPGRPAVPSARGAKGGLRRDAHSLAFLNEGQARGLLCFDRA